MSSKIRVLLVDDHTILRRGLRAILGSQEDMEVVGEAQNGREAVDEASRVKPDIILMDIAMPDLNGVEATRQICQEQNGARIIALTMHRDAVYVREILRAGARGYLLKDSEDAELVRAIRLVAKGEAYLSPSISDAVLSDYRRHVSNPLDVLTSREREVLTMVAEGKTNKEIANELKLSVYTIESHRGSLMEKLNLHNTGDMVRFAIRNGLVV